MSRDLVEETADFTVWRVTNQAGDVVGYDRVPRTSLPTVESGVIVPASPTGDPSLDTANLQAALDAVGPCSTVAIGPGEYLVNAVNAAMTGYNQFIGGGLRPRSGTTITMHPETVLRVAPNGSPGYACIYVGPGVRGVTIRGGSIMGDRAEHDYETNTSKPTHEWGYGVCLRGCEDVVIDGVAVSGCTGDSIAILPEGMIGLSPYTDAKRIMVKGSLLVGARRNNISVIGCNGVTIIDNDIRDAGSDDGIHDGCSPRMGIDIEGFGDGSRRYEEPLNVSVKGNRFSGNQAGSVMNYNGQGVVIDGNFSDATISLGYGTRAVVTGNILHDPTNTKTGLHVNGSPVTFTPGSVVTGNVVTGFKVGMDARGENLLVAGNSFRGCGEIGIQGWALSDSTLSGNFVQGAGQKGIDIRFNCARVNVVGNTVVGCPTAVRVEAGAVDVVHTGTVPAAI